jgi:hypothetical protein
MAPVPEKRQTPFATAKSIQKNPIHEVRAGGISLDPGGAKKAAACMMREEARELRALLVVERARQQSVRARGSAHKVAVPDEEPLPPGIQETMSYL